jgi:hypothetical protein
MKTHPTNPAASKFIAALTATPLLDDAEVAKAMLRELEREQGEASAAMVDIITEAKRHTYYLQPGIFDPIAEIEARAEKTQRIADKSTSTGIALAVLQGCAKDEWHILETARKLRAARALVSHADPATYWEDLRAVWSRLPIPLMLPATIQPRKA